MRYRLIAVALILVGLSLPSFADTIYVAGDNSNLYTIDPTTGATTFVGAMGVVMTDIALRNGAMYGVSFPASGPDSLYSINPNTGAATLVGGTGVFLNALEFGADGTLYGAGGAPGCGPPPHATTCNSFYKLDVGTGLATLIGTGTYDSAGDLAFVGSPLYLTSVLNASTDQLFTVNPTTGAGSLVGNIGFAQVFGLAYASGTLYGFNDVGNNVIRINTATGAGTSVATYSGFEILGATSVVVPEPRGLGALAGLVALVGVLVRRRVE